MDNAPSKMGKGKTFIFKWISKNIDQKTGGKSERRRGEQWDVLVIPLWKIVVKERGGGGGGEGILLDIRNLFYYRGFPIVFSFGDASSTEEQTSSLMSNFIAIKFFLQIV